MTQAIANGDPADGTPAAAAGETAAAAAGATERRRGLAALGPGGAAVAIAGMVVNALAYVIPVLGARQLTPSDLSALATVLAVGAIATVPALGLQAAVAVAWAKHGGVTNSVAVTAATAAAVTGLLVLATPFAVAGLRLSPVLMLLIAATAAAVVTASRWLGELQGIQRFGRLALGLALLAVARYGGVIVGLIAGAGVTSSIALGAAVSWLGAPLLALLARGGATPAAGAPAVRLTPRAILDASGATLAMLATSYADLILARNLLPPAESGSYAVGAVLTKGALWAPQVVTVLALPRLAQGSRRTLLVALSVVAACGAVLVGASALAGDLAMRLAGGAAYVGLAGYAAGFAAVGALYALAYVLVNAEIAARVRWPGAPLWFGLLVLVVVTRLLDPPTLGSVLATSITAAGLTVVAMSVIALLRARRDGLPPAGTGPATT